MKRFTALFFAAFFFQVFQVSAQCDELFFSEYVEGSGNNKALEIYNPTGVDIDLDANGYQVRIYSNGNGHFNSPITLTGVIPAHGTYVIAHGSSQTPILNVADQTHNSLGFNGDDVVALAVNGTNIDIIGKIDEDPGSQWGSGLISTQDNTIRRNASVTGGDTNGSDDFNPAVEWTGFASNTFDDLGSFDSDCPTDGGGGTNGCDELFFSEYIEGSSNHKGVEIYNPTDSDIDFSDYTLNRYSNGSSSASTINYAPGGTTIVPAGGVLRLTHTSAGIIDGDLESGSLNFNGNDVLELVKDGNRIDIIGAIGSSANFAKDVTLVRNANVMSGATTYDEAEWTSFPQNTTSNWGLHTSDCSQTSCMITSVAIIEATGCDDNGTLDPSDDYYLADIEVLFAGAPASGMLTLSGSINASVDVVDLGAGSYVFSTMEIPANGQALTVLASFTEDAACSLSQDLGTAEMPCSVVPDCAYPFFSEYIEGSANNKCLEIYNPSPNAIDLEAEGYMVSFYFNGNANAMTNISLEGTLASGASYVLCNQFAFPEATANATQTAAGSWYNGDDAITLSSNEGTIDVIGQIGFDPGSSWNNGGVSTQNMTMRRNRDVAAGDNNGTNPFDPSMEWTAFPINTFWGLGYQGSECLPSLPEGWMPFNVGDCAEGNNASFEDGIWTLNTACTPNNPSTTMDHGIFVATPVCGNVQVSASIESLVNGWAGLAIRESVAPNAKSVSLVRAGTPTAFKMEVRNSVGAPLYVKSITIPTSFKYVQLRRTGSKFRVYRSTNGTTWFPAGTPRNVNMASCTFAGMVTRSGAPNNVATAQFSNVTINGGTFGLVAANTTGAQQTAPATVAGIENATVAPLTISNDVELMYTLAPNPASLYTTLNFNKVVETEATISITNVNGQLVATQNVALSGRSYDVNLSTMSLVEGIYYLTLTTQEGVITKRFVKVN